MTRLGRARRCVKVRYATKVDALLGMKSMEIRVGFGYADSAPVRAYRCKRCARWHLTSQATRTRRRR